MRLHPALARIAVQYDQIVRDFRDGRMSNADARSRISMLSARDDTGVFWSIDPTTGAWLRKTVFGEWVPGTPPEYGLAQPTAFQLTGAHDPVGSRLRFDRVDESLALPPDSIVGATRRTTGQQNTKSVSAWWGKVWADKKRVVAWTIVFVVFLLALSMLFKAAGIGTPGPGVPGQPAGFTTPTTTWGHTKDLAAGDPVVTLPHVGMPADR